MQHRIVDRPDLELDPTRIVERLCQRDFIPGEPRLTHVDGNMFAIGDHNIEGTCRKPPTGDGELACMPKGPPPPPPE